MNRSGAKFSAPSRPALPAGIRSDPLQTGALFFALCARREARCRVGSPAPEKSLEAHATATAAKVIVFWRPTIQQKATRVVRNVQSAHNEEAVTTYNMCYVNYQRGKLWIRPYPVGYVENFRDQRGDCVQRLSDPAIVGGFNRSPDPEYSTGTTDSLDLLK